MVAKKRRTAVEELGPREVLIEDIGPIERLEFTAEPGTITVLRGRNGAGKSQALGAVDALVSGRSRLTGRDGTTGGTARGFGVKISVGRGGANRRSGELVVESIEDRLNIADLVDPGLKDVFAADGKRIRALVQLAGVVPSLDLFADLVDPAWLREIVPPATLESSDVVAVADAIKRAIESQARVKESEAENLARDAAAKRATVEGIDLESPCDEVELSESLESALSTYSRTIEQRKAGLAAQEKRAADLARLESLRNARAAFGSVDATRANLKSATDAEAVAQATVNRLRAELQAAESDLRVATTTRVAAADLLAAAERDSETLTALEQAVAGDLPAVPTEDDVAASCNVYTAAKAAMQQGVRVRDAIARVEAAEAIESQASEAAAVAEGLRDAAKGTGDVLSRIVADMGGAFLVDREFRLVVPGTERGSEYFAELSHGERWRLALTVAIEAFRRSGKPGLLSIPQECFEGLDGQSRRIIADAIRGSDLSVVTAEADHSENPSDEITVEQFAGAV